MTGGAFDSYLLHVGCERWCRVWSWRSVTRRRCEISANPAVGEKTVSPVAAGNQGHEIAARQQKGFGAMLSLNWMAMSRRCVVSWAGCRCLAGGIIRGSGKFNLSRRNHDTAGMAPEARAAAGISETLLRTPPVLKMAKI